MDKTNSAHANCFAIAIDSASITTMCLSGIGRNSRGSLVWRNISVAAMSSWEHPSTVADLINFPPLYSYGMLNESDSSIQVPENREAQYRIWTDIVIAYALKEKTWSISLQECPIFRRQSINRMFVGFVSA